MTPGNALYQLFKTNYSRVDPGNAATIITDRQFVFIPLVSAAAETRTLAQPAKAGLFTTLTFKTDAGDITLTVTGGYNADADTSITFSDAGDFVMFYSIEHGGSYYWRVVCQEGTNVAVEEGEFDALTVGAITGGDNSLGITGQTQATTVNGGAVAIAGAASIAGATGNGGAVTIAGGASGSTAGAGGAASVTGGLGTTTGNGGAASLAGGVAGATGTGGAASVTGGASAAGATGAGGACVLAGGASGSTDGAGGAASLTGGAGTGTGDGGAAALAGGVAPGTGNGGAVSVTGGATSGGATGTGGAVAIAGGANANTTNGAGGAATVTGGAGKGSGAGGAASLTGGASAGSGAGGNVTLTPGASGSGIPGGVLLRGDTFFAQDAATAEATGAQAVAAADFVNGIVVHTVAAASALSTPTGAQIAAVLPAGVTTGDAFRFHLITVGAGADDISTLTAGDGDVTFVGNVTVGPDDGTTNTNGFGTWIFRMTGATSFVGYRVG